MASRISVPAMTPRKLFHGSGVAGRRRLRLARFARSRRVPSRTGSAAAPAVTTEPVMTDPTPRRPRTRRLVAGLLDQRGGGLDGVGQRRRGDHPLRAEALLGEQRQRLDVHGRGEPLWVTTIWSKTGSSAARMPSTSLSAITETTPTRKRKSNSSLQRLRQRRRAGRVVRRIDEYRWRAAHPLQPARAGDGGEPVPDGVDVELTVRARTEERLDRGQCEHRVVRLVLTVQRQEDLGVHPAEALQLEQLPADGDLPAEHGELGVLAGDRGVGPHRLRQQHFHRLGRLLADDRDRVGRDQIVLLLVMMPAFSPAISAMVSPR